MKKLCVVLPAIIVGVMSCSAAKSGNVVVANNSNDQPQANNSVVNAGPKIDMTQGGPADTVRAFYQKLREKKFREAIFLTNLRPAVESLTDSELNDFSLDLEQLAGQVPAQIDINGEIISGDTAAVTVNFPNADTGKPETQRIALRKESDTWIIQTVDDTSAARIKKEGKSYLYNVRIEAHQDEARAMLDRVAKAQMAASAQNGGRYSTLEGLLSAQLLPEDIKTSASTGYNYEITVSGDATVYSASAIPAEYGKTGKLSFLLSLDPKRAPHLTSRDNGGKPLKN